MDERIRGRVMWRRMCLGGAAALALMAGAAEAGPAPLVDVGGAALEPALLDLARQTGEQIIFSKDVVEGLRAPNVEGRFSPEAALEQLLSGAGLQARRVRRGLIVVERVGAPDGEGDAAEPEARPFVTAAAGPTERLATGPERAAPTLLDELVVTGSNLRGVPSASPLLALDRADLERSGQTTLAGALRALPQNFAGGAAEGTATTGSDRLGRNSAFGSGVNLRGLGNNATLVLVNGRRIAGSGAFGDFADVSAIPTAAVERVEVLLDGASAIYGSDAVGGVVNIILRRDFDGAEARVLAGAATAGEPLEGQVSLTLGRRWDTGSVLLAYELRRRDALAGADRPFSATADLRPFGGGDQRQTNAFPGNLLGPDPGTGATVPRWAVPAGQPGTGLRPGDFVDGVPNLQNPREGIDLIPRQTLNAGYLAVRQALGERFEVSGDVRLSSRRYRLRTLPQSSSFVVNAGNPFFVSPNGSASHIVAYSFVGDLPNPVQTGTAETLTVTAGGTWRPRGDWRVEGHAAFGQEIDESHLGGVLNSAFLSEALGTVPDRPQTAFQAARDGYFNPFTGVAGSNSSLVTGFIGSGFTVSRTRNRIAAASLQADGTLLTLPGGALKLAVGVQARREALKRGGSNFISTVAPVAQTSADVSRDVLAAFAEARIPIVGEDNRRVGVERLELTLAGRVEDYEDAGSTANPKVGVLWAPAEGLTLRATYSESFRAPALREVSDAPIYSASLLPLGAARIRSLLLNGGNPDLKPETATSWTAGIDVAPPSWPGVRLSVSLFDVRFRDRIDRPVQANIVGALADPTLAAFVERISPATDPADLARITALINDPAFSSLSGPFPPEVFGAILDNRYVNTARLQVRGLDVTGSWRFTVGGDPVGLGANASYLFDYRQQVTPTSGTVERVGVANFPVKFRGRLVADWTHGSVTGVAALNYVGSYRDANGRRIGDHPTVDLQLRWTPERGGWLEGTAVTLSARNVFDNDPPFYDNPAGVAFDPANADPIGRFVAVQLTRSW